MSSLVSQTSRTTPSSSPRTGQRTLKFSTGTEARLHRRWIFLTYSQCSLNSKDEFQAGFSDMLQGNKLEDTTFYGCREHDDGKGTNYYVLVNLGKQVNWHFRFARSRFLVDGNECKSIDITTPRPKQSVQQFIEDRVLDCENAKGGDCFGQRPKCPSEKLERKRRCEEINEQPMAPVKLSKLKTAQPSRALSTTSQVDKSSSEMIGQGEAHCQVMALAGLLGGEATGSAVETPVMFDRRRLDAILAKWVNWESEVDALRNRVGGFARNEQEFYSKIVAARKKVQYLVEDYYTGFERD
ncbi:uncharacterized protein N7482_003894 [Penicillium canariense]|uniref:Uncharacterized protein n=1 Tax=Penicillium canariense TaxID=189055 RepID=A0A9W9I5L6_9EURO|nr:uncharacterized protein N7482_003894 [Penicillium canariense]KAJ5168300.1 hypothetical protein N7482_003894 [Penicillium canariense]